MKRLVALILVILTCTPVWAETYPVRIKDIGKIVEARDNQLIGFGLVVGLRNTGDSRATAVTEVALSNLLQRLGVSPSVFNSRNVAAVMVTATLPPFIKPGQRIPVTVSSIGDATSLLGGTLLITPMQGPDFQTYAVAQGPVLVNGLNETSSQSRYYRNQSTVGSIPDGAIVEQEVPVTFVDQHNITLVLNESNFATAARAAEAIQKEGYPGAKAVDANTIKVPLADLQSADLIETIADLENITLLPDPSAKIVINAKTGTVIIGEMVRLFPVAITHGELAVRIADNEGGVNLAAVEVGEDPIQIIEPSNRLVYLNPTATLSSLVNALNEIGASPRDLIAIIQALKESGALIATVEII